MLKIEIQICKKFNTETSLEDMRMRPDGTGWLQVTGSGNGVREEFDYRDASTLKRRRNKHRMLRERFDLMNGVNYKIF